MAQNAHYSTPDPEFQRLNENNPRKVHEPASDEEVIALSAQYCLDVWIPACHRNFAPYLPAEPKYTVEDHKVPVEGGEITVRATIPEKPSKESTFPLVVFFHGGSFFAGDMEMNDYEMRYLSNEVKVTTVNVNYRLAPHPIAHDDCYAAVKWAAEHADALSVDLNKGFIVMGSSAGGNLSAVMARRARDDPFFATRPITGQFLQIPSTCHPDYYPEEYKDQLLSMKQNEVVRGWLGASQVHRAYRFVGGSPTDPDISPLLTPSLAGLPPAVVQVDGLDPLRDEAILYAELMRRAGVKVKLEVYPGVPHSFEMYMPNIQLAKKYVRDAHEGVKWLLELK